MANFEVRVREIEEISPIENADNIEIARVDDFNCIVGKGQFQEGDLGVYIPESSIVPNYLLEKMNLVGKLAGKDKNRVKAIKLRGRLSQGLLLPLEEGKLKNEAGQEMKASLFHEVSEFLGIHKWEPPIPAQFNGKICHMDEKPVRFDVENLKKYPDVFEPMEEVVATTKMLGTCMITGVFPDFSEPYLFGHNQNIYVISKEFSHKEMTFMNTEENNGNVYVKALKDMLNVQYYAIDLYSRKIGKPIHVLGELVGMVFKI